MDHWNALLMNDTSDYLSLSYREIFLAAQVQQDSSQPSLRFVKTLHQAFVVMYVQLLIFLDALPHCRQQHFAEEIFCLALVHQ
jgi:hypothetical protein